MASISAVLRKDRPRKDGTYPIVFRLYHRKNYFYSSGQSVDEKSWDNSRSLVRSSHPLSDNINRLIESKVMAVNKYIIDCETKGVGINPSLVGQIVSGKSPSSFFTFADKRLEIIKKNNYTTGVKEQSIRDKIRRITGDILLDQITRSFLLDLKIKLAAIPNNPTTVNKAIDYMRDVYNMAVREGAVVPSPHPFYKINKRVSPRDKERLDKDEISSLHNLRDKLDGHKRLACDMFLFSYYMFGMRFKNIYRFEKNLIKGDRISYSMTKTGKKLYIKVHEKLGELLSDYIETPGQYLFPMGQRDFDTQKEEYMSVSSKNAMYNRYLKFVALDAGISKQIHFHMARHSFADNLRKAGADPVTAMNAMAHSDLSTTQRYFSSLDQEGLDSVGDIVYG